MEKTRTLENQLSILTARKDELAKDKEKLEDALLVLNLKIKNTKKKLEKEKQAIKRNIPGRDKEAEIVKFKELSYEELVSCREILEVILKNTEKGSQDYIKAEIKLKFIAKEIESRWSEFLF